MTITRKPKPRRGALRWLAHPYWVGISALLGLVVGIAAVVVEYLD